MSDIFSLEILPENDVPYLIKTELKTWEIGNVPFLGINDHDESQVLRDAMLKLKCASCGIEIIERCPDKVFVYSIVICPECKKIQYLFHIRFGGGLVRRTGSILFQATHVNDKLMNICQHIEGYKDPRDAIPNDPSITGDVDKYMEFYHMALISIAQRNSAKPYHISSSISPAITSPNKFPYLWYYWYIPSAVQARLSLYKTVRYIMTNYKITKYKYDFCRIERGVGTNVHGKWINWAMEKIGIDWFGVDQFRYYAFCSLIIPIQPTKIANQIQKEISEINFGQTVYAELDQGLFRPNEVINLSFPQSYPNENKIVKPISFFEDSAEEVINADRKEYLRFYWVINGY